MPMTFCEEDVPPVAHGLSSLDIRPPHRQTRRAGSRGRAGTGIGLNDWMGWG
jgi:hypothetical protein